MEEIRARDGNLSIPLYVAPQAIVDPPLGGESKTSLEAALGNWLQSSANVRQSLAGLFGGTLVEKRKS